MMKRFLILLVTFFTLSFSANLALAQERATSEAITDYNVDITVNKDSSIRVKEVISYDFASVPDRHGIFRNIPYKYNARGGNFALRISDISVKDEAGKDYNFVQSTSGGELSLKIGDADTTVTGAKNYVIEYTVKRAVNYFDDHDELYWNAIGTDWPVAIAKSKVTVHLPTSSTNAQCYIGALGSTETLCTITDNKLDTVVYAYDKPLAVGEGFTIVVGLPAGTLTKPTTTQKILDIVKDNGILALPLLVLGVMFYLWRKHGRDAKGKNTIVPQYEPPKDLPPLYMGALVDGRVDNKDISAEIVNLAVKGFLTITKIETKKLIWFKGSDYKFEKVEKDTTELLPQSKAVLAALFDGTNTAQLSEYKSDQGFGKALMKIKSDIFKELTASGYYRSNPKTMQIIFIGVAITVGVGGSLLLGTIFSAFGVIAAVLSGLIILIFSFLMPALTIKGVESRSYILGLKQYLGVAEKDRLEFHNAPEKNPKQFEMLLPFAMALGVERLWAAQFKDIYTQNPSWYSDSTSSTFNAAAFSTSLNDFSSSLQSAAGGAVSTASGGGSGFSGGGSGGGGGGGGGGSW